LIIIGIGNPFRSDDIAGLLAARALRDKVGSGVTVLEHDGEPASLIAAVEDAGAAILIDAVSSGAPAGALHVLNVREARFDRRLFRHSTHAFGVAEAVSLAAVLGKAPAAWWIVGIEGENFEPGRSVSPPVLGGVKRAVEAVLRKLNELGQ